MSNYQQPDASGHFGQFGGSFVSETLTHAIEAVEQSWVNGDAFFKFYEALKRLKGVVHSR